MKLKEIRLARQLTQDSIASKVGISRAFYTNIENGKRQPSVEVAQKIANVLEFDWTEFFNEKVEV